MADTEQNAPESEKPVVWPPPPEGQIPPSSSVPTRFLTGRKWLDEALGFFGSLVFGRFLRDMCAWFAYGYPRAWMLEHRNPALHLVAAAVVTLISGAFRFVCRKRYPALAYYALFGGFLPLILYAAAFFFG